MKWSRLLIVLVSSLFAVASHANSHPAQSATELGGDSASYDLHAKARALGISLDQDSKAGPGMPGEPLPPPPPACLALNLDGGQRNQIRDAMLQQQKDAVTLEANVKLARLDYLSLVLDSGADPSAAETAATNIADAVGKMIASQRALDAKILFEIVKADQREVAFDCMNQMRDMMQRAHLAHACQELGPPPPPPVGPGVTPPPGAPGATPPGPGPMPSGCPGPMPSGGPGPMPSGGPGPFPPGGPGPMPSGGPCPMPSGSPGSFPPPPGATTSANSGVHLT